MSRLIPKHTNLSLIKEFDFREFSDKQGNRVLGRTDYLNELLTNEYSPIKTLLQTIEPPAKIIINIDVQIIE